MAIPTEALVLGQRPYEMSASGVEFHEEKVKLCLLCFKLCGLNFQVVDDVMAKMMAIILLKCELEDRQPIICSKCLEDVKTCYEFKTSCLFLNKSPVSSATGENITKLDSFNRKEEIQSSGNNLFTSHSVCRLCMKSINTEFHNYLSDNRSDLTLNMQLQKYFPELVIKTSQDLSICTLCKISLEAYFDTMRNWSYAEENDEAHDVINETPKSHNDFNLGNEEKIKLYEYSVGTDAPSVTASGIPELSIKCEEVDIKMEGDSKRFAEDGTRIYQRNLDGANVEKISIEGQCKVTENANSKNGSRRTYHCDKCAYKTVLKEWLRKHMVIHEDSYEIPMYSCDTCGYKTKRKDRLRHHVEIHLDPSKVSMIQCEKCEFKTRRKDHLKKHMEMHLDPAEVIMHQCDKCEFKTRRKDNLRHHMERHEDRSDAVLYQCETCHFVTRRKNCLKQHMVLHQDPSQATVYSCDKCEFKARHKGNLTRHMETHQDPSNMVLYRCEECQYETIYKGYLKKHMMKHQQLYSCDQCEFTTKRKGNLKWHKEVHLDPFKVVLHQCEKCEYVTRRKDCLKNHMVVHKDPSEVTMHQCCKCDFKTKHKSSLRTHMVIHV